MKGKDSASGVRDMTVDTPLILHMFEPPTVDSLVKCDVPDSTGLFHAIDAFHELPNPVFLPRMFKARGCSM